METRAKFALIGLFTLCVIAAAFGFVFWFSGSRGGANLKSYQVVFDTPVTGLSRGRRGPVQRHSGRRGHGSELLPEGSEARRGARRHRARRAHQGVDQGEARVLGPDRRRFRSRSSIQTRSRRISSRNRAIRSPPCAPSPRRACRACSRRCRRAGKHADDILVKVDQIVADNQAPINHIIANIEKLSDALDAAKINAAVDNISAIAQKFDVEKLNHAIGSIDTVVSSLDTSTVNHTLKSVDTFATALGDSSDNLRAVPMTPPSSRRSSRARRPRSTTSSRRMRGPLTTRSPISTRFSAASTPRSSPAPSTTSRNSRPRCATTAPASTRSPRTRMSSSPSSMPAPTRSTRS